MNIWEEYKQQRELLQPLAKRINKTLEASNIHSVETMLIFEAICLNDTTLSVVAKQFDMNTGSVSTIIKSLVTKGYIIQLDDPTDTTNRALKRKLLKATDKGQKVYQSLLQQFSE